MLLDFEVDLCPVPFSVHYLFFFFFKRLHVCVCLSACDEVLFVSFFMSRTRLSFEPASIKFNPNKLCRTIFFFFFPLSLQFKLKTDERLDLPTYTVCLSMAMRACACVCVCSRMTHLDKITSSPVVLLLLPFLGEV